MDNMKRILERGLSSETDVYQLMRSVIPLHVHVASKEGRLRAGDGTVVSGAVLVDVPVGEADVVSELLQRLEINEASASSISDDQLLTVDQIHSAALRLLRCASDGCDITEASSIVASLLDSFSRRLS
jgi:hypothetical protein